MTTIRSISSQEMIREQIRDQIAVDASRQTPSPAWGEIRDYIDDQVWMPVEDQIWFQIRSQIRDQIAASE